MSSGLESLGLSRRNFRDFLGQPPEEPSLDEQLGLQAPPDAPSAPTFQEPTGYERLLESLAMSGAQAPNPRNFGEGLVAGLGQGLQNAGAKVVQRRQLFQEQQAKRQAQADSDRRDATKRYQEARTQGGMDLAGEKRKAVADIAGEGRKTKSKEQFVGPDLAASMPQLARFEGQTISGELFDALKGQKLPESTPYKIKGVPATREEYIKSLATPKPDKERLVQIEGPNGPVYVRESEALGKPPPKPAGAQAGKLPVATERAALATDSAAISQMGALEKLYARDYVGPGRGRVAAAQASGVPLVGRLSGKQGDFRAALAQLRNAVINQLSGAAVSESEAKRMEQQLPNENDPSEAFEAKLRQTRANIERLAATRRQTYAETGLDLSGLSGGGQAPITTQYKAGGFFDANRRGSP